MKKIVIVMLLVSMVLGGVFAQSNQGGRFLINAGIGFSPPAYDGSFSASAEYLLSNMPLSIGVYAGLAMPKTTEATTGSGSFALTVKTETGAIGFGAIASYHFNLNNNFNPYVSIVIGSLTIQGSTEASGYGAGSIGGGRYSTSGMLFGINAGVRYFFTSNIGLFAELGYSPISIATLGLTLRF